MPTPYWLNIKTSGDWPTQFAHNRYPIDFPLSITAKQLAILKSNTKMERVLDFGSGMGRMTVSLHRLFREVYTFDTEVMTLAFAQHILEVLRTDKSKPIPILQASFDEVKSRRYDLIFDRTCWQHITPSELQPLLISLCYTAPYAFSFTRWYNDFTKDKLIDIVESSGAWKVIDCSEPEVINNEAHFAVLYQSLSKIVFSP